MADRHLAVMVYSELIARPPDPRIQGFIDRLEPYFDLAMKHDGFVRYVGNDVKRQEGVDPAEWDWGPWGEFDEPYWYDGPTGPGRLTAKQISVWEDLESVQSYTYRTDHVEAYRKRKEWVADRDVPNHVAWWITAATLPTWGEACRRIEHLHEHGSTPRAFTLRKAFDPQGAPASKP